MKFKFAILIGVLPLVVGILAATVAGVSAVLHEGARASIAADLSRGRRVFQDLQEYRRSLLLSQNRVVAEEPRLKAVAATENVNRATVVEVAEELHKLVGSDLFLITDPAGRLVVDIADPTTVGSDLSGYAVVKRAFADGDASDFWSKEGRVYQVQVSRLSFGSTVAGGLVVGHALDDRTAETVHAQTASQVVVALGDDVVAAWPPELRARLTPAVLARLPIEALDPIEVDLEGRYLVSSARLPGYTGVKPLRVLVLRSLDEALAPARTLIRYLVLLLAGAIAGAVLLSVRLARRLARPVDRLVALTRDVAAGKLGSRVSPENPAEMRALGVAMNDMLDQIDGARRALAERERVAREMEIAAQIQTAILPQGTTIAAFELAGGLRPATEVGGDYYDILPVEGGCWLGIGDVSGHGLQAGLVMLMAQSGLGTLSHSQPLPTPAGAVAALNGLLVENVRRRSHRNEHLTLTLLHCRNDGRVVFAGAHEDIVLWRARHRGCEVVKTTGAWFGIKDSARIVERAFQLEPGDLMLLHTDGATEATNAAGEELGLERLGAVLAASSQEPVEQIRDRLLGRVADWTAEQRDDVTVLVARFAGPPPQEPAHGN
jgi:sigma-B regulation protein RsbU (phosphoserine phosphatase)